MARGMVGSAGQMERIDGADIAADFDAVVLTYEAPISRYLYGMVGDQELARDLAQETFISAYRALPGTEITNLSGWLYRIATNHAMSHFRRKKLISWMPLGHLIDVGREPSSSGHGEWVATSESIDAALSQLDPKDRGCLLLKASGFSSLEIAEQLGCSEGAARTRLSRAREAFRRIYNDDFDLEAEDR